ncbi:MAG: DUF3078 domain-containing protein [Ferruginibacter sp.]
MKRILSFLAVTALGMQVLVAQDAAVKQIQTTATTTVKTDEGKVGKNGWKKGGSISVALTQVGNSNWIAAGGDKFSLSTAASLNAFASKKWGRKSWDNILDVNYGLINTSSLGVRKINDRIDFLSKFGYQPKNWKKVSYSVLGQLRSQLTSGYEYDYYGTTTKRRNSGFFAPAYIVVAPGVDWKPNSWFSLFGSPLATRWTIVSNGPYSYAAQGGVFNGNIETPLATIYGVNPAKPHRGEFGAFVTATAKKDILKNVNWYSKIDLYSNYLKNAQNIDVFWTNQFKMRVNKWIQVSYTLDMLYDDDIKQKSVNPNVASKTIGLQVLSTLGVGFAYKF